MTSEGSKISNKKMNQIRHGVSATMDDMMDRKCDFSQTSFVNASAVVHTDVPYPQEPAVVSSSIDYVIDTVVNPCSEGKLVPESTNKRKFEQLGTEDVIISHANRSSHHIGRFEVLAQVEHGRTNSKKAVQSPQLSATQPVSSVPLPPTSATVSRASHAQVSVSIEEFDIPVAVTTTSNDDTASASTIMKPNALLLQQSSSVTSAGGAPVPDIIRAQAQSNFSAASHKSIRDPPIHLESAGLAMSPTFDVNDINRSLYNCSVV